MLLSPSFGTKIDCAILVTKMAEASSKAMDASGNSEVSLEKVVAYTNVCF